MVISVEKDSELDWESCISLSESAFPESSWSFPRFPAFPSAAESARSAGSCDGDKNTDSGGKVHEIDSNGGTQASVVANTGAPTDADAEVLVLILDCVGDVFDSVNA